MGALILAVVLCANLVAPAVEATLDLSPAALAFGDRYCTCDLTPDACDLNCCCDADCTDDDITSFFSQPCASRDVAAPVLLESCDVADELLMLHSPSIWDVLRSVLCVERTNQVDTVPFREQPQTTNPIFQPSALQELLSSQDTDAAAAVEDGTYDQGDPLLTATSSPPAIDTAAPFTVPSGVLGQGCGGARRVHFLDDDIKTTCVRQFDGEADLASACSGLLSIDAFVTSLSSIIANPATLQLVSVVLPPSGLPDTTFINGTCAHAAASIAVTFIWGEDGVSAAHVDVTAANVTQSQPFVQTFAVTFARSTDAKVRSGRPGYLDGRPLLMQDFEYSLIGVDARSTRCSEVGRRPLAFNENSLSMCQLEFSVDDFSDCNALRANFRQHLGLPSSSSVPGRVGIYGDSDTSAAGEWIDVIHTTTREYADQELFLNYTQRPLCNDVPRRAEIQVLVTSQGHPQNPQMIVFGAQVTTYTRHLYITATTPAPPVSNVTLTTAPPTNTTAAPTNATAAPSNATAEPVRQVELVSVGVSFVYVDPGAAGLKRRRNHRPHSCFRGTCWHVPFRTAQRRWTTDPQVQAHYAAVLARFIAVMICIACLGVLSLVIHMQGPRR